MVGLQQPDWRAWSTAQGRPAGRSLQLRPTEQRDFSIGQSGPRQFTAKPHETAGTRLSRLLLFRAVGQCLCGGASKGAREFEADLPQPLA